MPDWVKVASIVRPRGVKGEVIAEAGNWGTDDLRSFAMVLCPGERPVELEDAWPHQGRMVLKFRGIDTVEAAEELRDAELCIDRKDRPAAPEGEFFFSDLIGCHVIELKTGEDLGEVTDCQEYGGPLVLEVMHGGRELLIPFANAICKHVDIEAKRIEVDLPEGLRDL